MSLRAGKYVPCLRCGKEKWFAPSKLKRNKLFFCGSDCEHRYQRVAVVCDTCGKSFERDQNAVKRNKRGMFCSRPCYSKWRSENLARENSSAWIDGRSEKYGHRLWKAQRARALERDGYVCQRCGLRPKNRNCDVHHIKEADSFSSYDKAHALENLITICRKCHANEHKKEETPK